MATLEAARSFSRRTILKSAAAVAVVSAAAPWIVRKAFADSGELNFMTWEGYDFSKAMQAFKDATGITVNLTQLGDQDEMMAQMKATGAEGFDIAEPTTDRVLNWLEQDLVQPIDETKVKMDQYVPAFLEGSAGQDMMQEGKRYAVPTIWGTESLTFNKEKAPEKYPDASYGDLWKPEYSGKVNVRPHSGLAGIGLWLEKQGKLPAPYRDAYKDEATMTKVYDVIMETALKVRPQVGQWWSNENEAQGGYRTNGMVIGMNWDTSAAALINEGLPIGYIAPKEGALAWIQNLVVTKNVKNADQAYAFINWLSTPAGAVEWAQAYSAFPTAVGAADALPEARKNFLAEAFPGDALKELWWWPAQPSWFISKRNEYRDRWQAAS